MSPQTGPDLVSAGYPISRPLNALLGGLTNATAPNTGPRSNLDWYGLGGNWTDRAGQASASQQALSVAVPVVPGDVISSVTYLVGATANGSPVHSWVALYSGTGSAPGTAGVSPTLIAQSSDAVGAAGAASPSRRLTVSFANPVTISSTQCPYGFIYVSFSTMSVSNGPSPSLISATVASPTYQWFTNGPAFLAGFHDTSSTASGVAPATMGTATVIANPPIVILT